MNGIIRRIAPGGVLSRASGGVVGGALMLALCACDSKTVTAQNASTAEVAQKVKASGIAEEGFISAGKWRTTMTIKDMQIPGMPPEAAGRMKAQMGKARSFDHCVTAEEAKKPKEDFFAGEQAKSCRYDNFTMGGGKIAMVMHCASEQGKQTMTMNGTYGADAYHMTMQSKAEMQGGGPMGAMTFDAVLDAKKIGLCTGKEKD
jgi:hypothetical protein